MTHNTHSRSSAKLLVRLGTALLALTMAATSVAIAPQSAQAAYPSFTFAGAGYGHGIGLSQYGAKGWAEHGKTGQWIATYYYPGTTIGNVTAENVSVNIDAGKTEANGGYARSSWQVKPGDAASHFSLSAGTAQATLAAANGPYTISASGTNVRVADKNGAAVGTYAGTVTLTPVDGAWPPLTQVVGASGPYNHTNVRYRGAMRFTSNGTLVKAVNRLPMQHYLYGVVPRESPASWHIEALKAQAIVARSYAWPSRTSELYCTTWSQVYNGHSRINSTGVLEMHENANSNQAVDVTNLQTVKYAGAVVKTFFHSSSGGHTANIEDVWLSTGEPSTLKPYRAGVPDPYSFGPADPWSGTNLKTFDGMVLANKLKGKTATEPAGAGTTVYVKSLGIDRAFPSDFVRNVDVYWSNGTVSRDVTGDEVRNALGLRSTKFFVGGRYTRIYYPDRYSTSVKVSQSAFAAPGSASVAVVVNGADDKFADALTSAALGGAANGPVLMTMGGELPSIVKDELKRLAVGKVYIVGGGASVSSAVESQIKAALPSASIVRLAGGNGLTTDRYGTAASVALEMKKLPGVTFDKALVASGQIWSDAAVAAATAAGAKRPLLLTASGSLPPSTATALTQLGVKETAVFGGPKTIGDTAIRQILAITKEAQPTRRFGLTGDRYSVATQAAAWCVQSFGYTLGTVYITTGEKFPDTVTGGVLAGRNRFPLLLTPTAQPSDATAAYLSANRAAAGEIVVIGGPKSVSDYAASTLAGYAY